MKILSITAQKPHSTGSGTYLSELVNAFDRQGVEQAVVAGVYRDDAVRFPDAVQFYPVYFSCNDSDAYSAADCDIPYPIVGMSDAMPYNSTRYRDLNDDMITEFESSFLTQIHNAIDNLDPDIIICHHLFLLTAMVRKEFPDRKVYGICHGTDLRQMINCPDLAEFIRPQIQKLDCIFALHNDQAEQISDIFQIPTTRIRVIGSGYNDCVFNTNSRTAYRQGQPVRICYAGKISRAKGIVELFTALEQLHSDPAISEFSVTLAGGCKDTAIADRLSALPDYINYLGQIPQQQLAQVFKSNDIFVLPSFFEGLNLATIEAMASGLIPICTDLPGMQGWVDENVKNSNIRYIPMPEMESIDAPTEKGRSQFVSDLIDTLGHAINDVASGLATPLPDTSGITWDSVATSIIFL